MNELECYKLLLGYTLAIILNANDFFAYGAADDVEVDPFDLEWIMPIIQKYGEDGIHACMSHIRQAKPLDSYINDNYKAALKELTDSSPEVWSER